MFEDFRKENFFKSIIAKAIIWGIIFLFITFTASFFGDLLVCGGISGCEFAMLAGFKDDLHLFALSSFILGIIVVYIQKNKSHN